MHGSQSMAIKSVLLAVFFTLMYKTGRTISARFNKNDEFRFGNFEKIADGQIFVKKWNSCEQLVEKI
jgi:hypothetical protein